MQQHIGDATAILQGLQTYYLPSVYANGENTDVKTRTLKQKQKQKQMTMADFGCDNLIELKRWLTDQGVKGITGLKLPSLLARATAVVAVPLNNKTARIEALNRQWRRERLAITELKTNAPMDSEQKQKQQRKKKRLHNDITDICKRKKPKIDVSANKTKGADTETKTKRKINRKTDGEAKTKKVQTTTKTLKKKTAGMDSKTLVKTLIKPLVQPPHGGFGCSFLTPVEDADGHMRTPVFCETGDRLIACEDTSTSNPILTTKKPVHKTNRAQKNVKLDPLDELRLLDAQIAEWLFEHLGSSIISADVTKKSAIHNDTRDSIHDNDPILCLTPVVAQFVRILSEEERKYRAAFNFYANRKRIRRKRHNIDQNRLFSWSHSWIGSLSSVFCRMLPWSPLFVQNPAGKDRIQGRMVKIMGMVGPQKEAQQLLNLTLRLRDVVIGMFLQQLAAFPTVLCDMIIEHLANEWVFTNCDANQVGLVRLHVRSHSGCYLSNRLDIKPTFHEW